jgi:predicted alpha/beta hydrolase family esterase
MTNSEEPDMSDTVDRRFSSCRDCATTCQNTGSRFVELGNVGHLNPAAGYGEWPRAIEFIRELA